MNRLLRSITRLSLILTLAVAAAHATNSTQTTVARDAVRPATPAPLAIPAVTPVEPVVSPTPAAVAAVAVPAVMGRRAELTQAVHGLSPEVLAKALDAASCARAQGVAAREDLLTVIDYSLPSTEPRLWVLDLERGEVLFHELVAHGAGTGDNYARRFSNTMDSRQTSLGLFVTGGTYQGGNGYSMKLRGLEPGINDRAEERHIVMYGAWYVNAGHARQNGRIGRSWGCPAVSDAVAASVIDTVKGGSFVFSYHPEDTWLASSRFTNGCPAGGAAPQVVRAAR